MVLAEELPLTGAESRLIEVARDGTDGTTELQNERIAAYLERGSADAKLEKPQ